MNMRMEVQFTAVAALEDGSELRVKLAHVPNFDLAPPDSELVPTEFRPIDGPEEPVRVLRVTILVNDLFPLREIDEEGLILQKGKTLATFPLPFRTKPGADE